MNRFSDLSYNPDTGDFYWLPTASRNAGKIAGGICKQWGYRKIMIDGRLQMAHRLAWRIVYGYEPDLEIDHINGIKSDNRLANLRTASRAQNAQNQLRPHNDSNSGVLGVSWHEPTSRWRARITADGVDYFLGYFVSKEEAEQKYKSAKMLHHEGRGL